MLFVKFGAATVAMGFGASSGIESVPEFASRIFCIEIGVELFLENSAMAFPAVGFAGTVFLASSDSEKGLVPRMVGDPPEGIFKLPLLLACELSELNGLNFWLDDSEDPDRPRCLDKTI